MNDAQGVSGVILKRSVRLTRAFVELWQLFLCPNSHFLHGRQWPPVNQQRELIVCWTDAVKSQKL